MAITQDTYMIVKKEIDELLFRIWLLDGKSTMQEDQEKNTKNKPLISFDFAVPLTGYEKNKLEDMYQHALTILRDAYSYLQKGGKVDFVSFSKSGQINVEQTINTSQELIAWIKELDNFGMNTSKSKKIFLQALKGQ
jgi:threonine dehydrogenase-like Zn-dependent dehydrogenase